MRARLNKRHNIIIKKSYGIGMIVFLILLFSFSFLKKFNYNITPKLLMIAQTSINKLNESILTKYRVSNIFTKVELDNVIRIQKNKNDEIISVDFQLENAYNALADITKYLQSNLDNQEIREDILKYYNKDLSSRLDSIVLSIPIGVASDDIFLANLGPRIPVKVNYMGYLATSIRIKLEDYGINNVLVSLYVDCSITNEFIGPVIEKEINHEYSILIASKIIQGVVPDYYGGVLEKKSNVLNLPIE